MNRIFLFQVNQLTRTLLSFFCFRFKNSFSRSSVVMQHSIVIVSIPRFKLKFILFLLFFSSSNERRGQTETFDSQMKLMNCIYLIVVSRKKPKVYWNCSRCRWHSSETRERVAMPPIGRTTTSTSCDVTLDWNKWYRSLRPAAVSDRRTPRSSSRHKAVNLENMKRLS